MSIDAALQHCAVLGAAGEMGRGIALLTLKEMAFVEACNYGVTGTGRYQLILIDSRLETLAPLRRYLREQLQRYAEEKIDSLRNAYAADATRASNREVVAAFVEGALDNVCCSTELPAAEPAHLIFEALPEDIHLKCSALRALHSHATQKQCYFSNTSSIPIFLLNQQAELGGSLLGLRFYSPPAVQQLVEVVSLPGGDPLCARCAAALIARFEKTAVRSRDLPGFIGNGYLMREIAFACRMAEQLKPLLGWPEALYAVDSLTRDFLIRPMGIFQFIDSIGVETCAQIAAVMGSLLRDSDVIAPQVASMAARGFKGGQDIEGALQPGFFRYKKGVPAAIYDEKSTGYLSLEGERWRRALAVLEPLPEGNLSWEQFSKHSDRDELLERYFHNLASMKQIGASLAANYLCTCHLIANALVESGVAESARDVDLTLTLGFHHLYSPLANWMPSTILAKGPVSGRREL